MAYQSFINQAFDSIYRKKQQGQGYGGFRPTKPITQISGSQGTFADISQSFGGYQTQMPSDSYFGGPGTKPITQISGSQFPLGGWSEQPQYSSPVSDALTEATSPYPTPTFAGYENLGMDEYLPQGPPYYGYTKNEYINMLSQGTMPKGLTSGLTPYQTGIADLLKNIGGQEWFGTSGQPGSDISGTFPTYEEYLKNIGM